LVIDGEVVSADANGRPNFGALQDDLKQRRYDRMVYYAFDLLHLDGFDTRAAPLIERKRVLQGFLAEAAVSGIIFSEQFDDGADLYKLSLLATSDLLKNAYCGFGRPSGFSGIAEDAVEAWGWKRLPSGIWHKRTGMQPVGLPKWNYLRFSR